MKTHQAISVLALMLLLTLPCTAGILVVDNNPGNAAHYSTLAAAMSAASAGDTILVVGSPDSYGRLTLNKRLVLFGPGYLLTSNPGTQAIKLPATASFTFNSGSEGSVVCGFLMYDQLQINVNNITVKRNYWNFFYNSQMINVGNGSNVVIKQNYIRNTTTGDYPAIYCSQNTSSVVIANNYLYSNGGTSLYLESGGGPFYVDNNVFEGKLLIYNSILTGNIWANTGTLSGSGNTFQYNLCAGTQFPDANGNIREVDMATVFLNSGSTDARWQLLEGSPAIGAGPGGIDCGMFGGNDPYVLSGMPPIPSITDFFAPSTASQASGLDVQLKAKSHN